MESNERYYRRRAVEERMAAQRAVTEQARAWHAKLAAEFSKRQKAVEEIGAKVEEVKKVVTTAATDAQAHRDESKHEMPAIRPDQQSPGID